MKKTSIIIASILSALVYLSACHSHDHGTDEHSHEAAAQDEHADHDEGIHLSREQAESIGLEVGAPTQISMGENVKVTGELELFPQDRARVSSFVGGNVKSIKVIAGDEVQKGEVIATLEHPDYIEMQQQLQSLHNQLDYLEQEYKRKEELHKEKITSGKEFQKAKADYFSAVSEVKGLKAKLKMLGLNVEKVLAGDIYEDVPVRANIDGFIHKINVAIGDYAEPQKTMFEITQNERIHVDLRVYEKDIHKVKEEQKVYFTVANRPDHLLEAKIHAVGKAFEENPKAIHVHAHIENSTGDLIPGMYVEGRIVVDEQPRTMVPEGAVVTEGGHSFVFVLEEENDSTEMHFQRVAVNTGIEHDNWVEIAFLETQPAKVQLALKEAYTLLSSMDSGEREHHH